MQRLRHVAFGGVVIWSVVGVVTSSVGDVVGSIAGVEVTSAEVVSSVVGVVASMAVVEVTPPIPKILRTLAVEAWSGAPVKCIYVDLVYIKTFLLPDVLSVSYSVHYTVYGVQCTVNSIW